MATLCNFGQIPDIRFKTLCCNGQIVIDKNCDLFSSNAFVESMLTVGVGGDVNFAGTSVDLRQSVVDFAGATVLNLNGNISGNIIAGTISGNLVSANIFGTLIGDVFGNLVGDLIGDILGNIRGNIFAKTFLVQQLTANNLTVMNCLQTDLLKANNLQSNLCIDSGFAVEFKTGSELRGNICIPGGSILNLKEGLTVNLNTAFGTENDGDILYHNGNVTTNLPLGNTNNVLISDGSTLVWSDTICLETIKANVLEANITTIGNIIILNPEFNLVQANTIIIRDDLVILPGGNITAPKITANVCGNLLNANTIVTGNLCIQGETTFKDDVTLTLGADLTLEAGSDLTIGTTLITQTGTVLDITQDVNIDDDLTVCGILIVDTINAKTGGNNILTTAGTGLTTITSDALVVNNSGTLNGVLAIGADPITFTNVGATLTQSFGNLTFDGADIIINDDLCVGGELSVDTINPKTPNGNISFCGNIEIGNVTTKSGNIINIFANANISSNLTVCGIIRTDTLLPKFRSNCIAYFIDAVTDPTSVMDSVPTPVDVETGTANISNGIITTSVSEIIVPVEGIYKVDVMIVWDETPTAIAPSGFITYPHFLDIFVGGSTINTGGVGLPGLGALFQSIEQRLDGNVFTQHMSAIVSIDDVSDPIEFVLEQRTGQTRLTQGRFSVYQIL